MPLDYLTAESDEVRNARASLDRIERALRKAEAHHVPAIGNERYLNGYEVCEYLHLSPRTLQTLRDTRQIAYTAVSGRVFLYPEKGIREILERNLRPAEKR
jgi:hypothetical protein